MKAGENSLKAELQWFPKQPKDGTPTGGGTWANFPDGNACDKNRRSAGWRFIAGISPSQTRY